MYICTTALIQGKREEVFQQVNHSLAGFLLLGHRVTTEEHKADNHFGYVTFFCKTAQWHFPMASLRKKL